MANSAKKQIKEARKVLAEVMRSAAQPIAYSMIEYVMKRARNSTQSQLINATKDIPVVGAAAYKRLMIDVLAALSKDSIEQAKSEIPGAKKIKLADIDDLTPNLRKKIKLQSNVLVDTQMNDLVKTITTSYMHNHSATDSMNEIEQELYDSVDDYMGGNSIEAASFVSASTTIASARDAVFDDKEINELLDALMFVNGDPVTPICTELAGTVFAPDDPDRFKYTPPLHWNCQSYIVPIPVGKLGNREIEKLNPSKTAVKSIQFEEQFANAIKSMTMSM